ncbi:MAG: lipase maturation factor family protein [Chromatiales bacterium]
MRLPQAARWYRWLIAPDERYRLTAELFLRVIALAYLAAFVSAALSITGLVGELGILPAGDYLDRLGQHNGGLAWLRFPTLFWLGHSDTALRGAAYLGCMLSVLLLIGWRPLLSSSLLFVLYLSLYRVGQIFFNFQWDYLLLEAGFLSIFLTAGPSRLIVFLFHWLLFRLRFLSGLSKLMSGDPSWTGLSAVKHYFETQPLPHMGSWYAHQLPEWLLKTGTGFTLFAELIVPFFIFLPRPFRLFAAGVTLAIQLLIVASSNHNFSNLLTIALCLFLLDDRALRRVVPARWLGEPQEMRPRFLSTKLLPIAAVVLLTASSYAMVLFVTDRRAEAAWTTPLEWVQDWGLANVYHVFPIMQTERHELIIQGSHDGRRWQTYQFRYKPDHPDDRPRLALPLHPHLDWMMWFVPTQNPVMRFWFDRFMWRLHQNSPAVTALLEHNPFEASAPRYLRVLVYRYRYSTPEERERDGRIWQVEFLGEFPFVPPRVP